MTTSKSLTRRQDISFVVYFLHKYLFDSKTSNSMDKNMLEITTPYNIKILRLDVTIFHLLSNPCRVVTIFTLFYNLYWRLG